MATTSKSAAKKRAPPRKSARIPGTTGRTAKAKAAAHISTSRKGAVSGAFYQVFQITPHERIDVIKRGVPAVHVGELARRMDIPKDALIDTLRLSRATVNRKAREKKPLSQEESERVLGIDYLIGQVESMVKESGDPAGFDAARWTSAWLNSPLPALGNKTPASYMDTVEGQKLVSNLLATSQSGAYA